MKQKKYKGATSMIVVIFFALLAGILVLSFASIMITNMRETTNYSLSQSALDAAHAGVEDAKILILEYKNCISKNIVTGSCPDIKTKIEAQSAEDNCDLVREALGRSGEDSDKETKIRTEIEGSSDVAANNLELAYTCVKVNMNPDDYVGTLNGQEDYGTELIPLQAVEDEAANYHGEISQIKISWYNSDNSENAEGSYSSIASDASIFPTGEGGFNNNNYNQYGTEPVAPSVLNVGFFQVGDSFSLTDFYRNDNNNTSRGFLSLRPRIGIEKSNDIGASALSGSVKNGGILSNNGIGVSGSPNSPIDIDCEDLSVVAEDSDAPAYACTATIEIPNTYRGGAASNDGRFLLLSVPYSAPTTSYRVTMYSSDGTPRRFKDGQIKVDATGRANNIFRRIESRIKIHNSSIPMPKYALSSTGGTNIEKAFEVTTNRWCPNGGSYFQGGNDCKDYYKRKPENINNDFD